MAMPAARYLQKLRTRQGQSAGAVIKITAIYDRATDSSLC
jgi:hypothetical protein